MSRGTRAPAPPSFPFHLRGSHPLWPWFPPRSATGRSDGGSTVALPRWPHNPASTTSTDLAWLRFGLIPVRSPLLRESRLISTPRGTKMFQFPRFPSPPYGFRRRCMSTTPCTLPHSGIPGSSPADGSPKLIAVYHALHRLLAPRHPPYALCCAAHALSRTRHTPDLASFSTNYALVKGLDRASATLRRFVSPSDRSTARAVHRSLRPTNQGAMLFVKVLTRRAVGTKKPAAHPADRLTAFRGLRLCSSWRAPLLHWMLSLAACALRPIRAAQYLL